MANIDEFFGNFETDLPETTLEKQSLKKKLKNGNVSSKKLQVKETMTGNDDFEADLPETTVERKKSLKKKLASGEESTKEPKKKLKTEDASATVLSKKDKVKKVLAGEEEEFMKFLENEDPELLDFEDDDLNDSEEEVDNESENDAEPASEFVGDENYMQKEGEEESEDENDNDEDGDLEAELNRQSFSNGLKKWSKEFESSSANLSTCVKTMRAFCKLVSAVTNTGDEKQSGQQSTEGMEDGNFLAAVLDLNVAHLRPCLNKALGTKLADKREMDYNELPQWMSVSAILQKYFKSCLEFVAVEINSSLSYKIFKHLIILRKYLKCCKKSLILAFKTSMEAWATSKNKEVELSAFILIERLVKQDMDQHHSEITKKALSTYTKISTYTYASSSETYPKIVFMQQCLIQLFAMDLNLTYTLAYNSLKTMVITIKALTLEQKEDKQHELCSWKNVHALYLWVSMFGSIKNYGILQSLIYPIVETINEILAYVAFQPRYYPLRFHCVDMLIMLEKHTDTFIPVFRHLITIFSVTDFNKLRKMSVRPFNISATLRFSETDMQERGFLDAVSDSMYRLMLEVANHHAYSIAAPELFLVPIVHIKKFCKACSNVKYATMFKQLVTKLEESAQFIAQERESVTFNVNDTKEIAKWEESMKVKNQSPITSFHDKFVKIAMKNKEMIDFTKRHFGSDEANNENRWANANRTFNAGGRGWNKDGKIQKRKTGKFSGGKNFGGKKFSGKHSKGNKFSPKNKKSGSMKRR